MIRGIRLLVLSATLAWGAGAWPETGGAAYAQSAEQDAEVAQFVQALSPVPPDIRMPTHFEANLLAQNLQRLNDTSGNFFRLAAHKRAIELVSESFGPDHPLTGQLLVLQSRQMLEAQDFAGAKAQLERGEAILTRRLGPDDPALLAVRYGRINLLDIEGRHLEQLVETDGLREFVERIQPDDQNAVLGALDARSVALYRLGRFPEACETGAQVLAGTELLFGADSGQFANALAGQVINLVAAGRLAEARALLETRSPMAALDPVADRMAIGRLHRAEAAIAEARFEYDAAKAALDKAHHIFAAAEFRTPDGVLDPDYDTAGATRTALDMERLLYLKHHTLGLVQPDWFYPVPLRLEVDGEEVLSWSREANGPWTIDTRLEAMWAYNNALDQQRSEQDLDLAEGYWRSLIDYHTRGTGPDSAVTAAARVDLADNFLRNFKPFAAQAEAEEAGAVLEARLGANHPLTLRARSVAALALARQGRREPATQAIDTLLEATWAAGEQARADMLDLLIERDALLRYERDPRGRLAFWETWGERVQSSLTMSAFEQTETQLRSLMHAMQAATDANVCSPPEEVAQLRATLDGFRLVPPDGNAPYVPQYLQAPGRILEQAVAETLACGDTDGDRLFEYLKDRNSRADFLLARESASAMVARYDRWAKLLIRARGFGRSQEHTDLAQLFLSRAQAIAEQQIENARDAGGASATSADARQRQVLASEGVGLDYRYALETVLEASWRYVQAQQGQPTNAPQGTAFYSVGAHDGFDIAFHAAQYLRLDGNSQALALASARAAAPDPELRGIVGEYQALSSELFRRLSAGGEKDRALEQVQARHAALAERIARDFPDYYRFAAPAPLTAFDARRALEEGEGLLTIMTVGDDVYVFALSATSFGPRAWHRIERGRAEVEELVRILRCDLDPVECGRGSSVQTRGGGADGVLESWAGYDFNRTAAWELYDLLIAPVAHVFEGDDLTARTQRLYVVTSGAASALPLSVLLTQAPTDGGFETQGAVYRDAPWLANRFDLAYLPAVSDLAGSQKTAAARGRGFIGYGDPALDPAPEQREPGKRGASLFASSRGAIGPLANPRALMEMKRLPGAEAELAAVAQLFPGSARLVTRDEAIEPRVKQERGFAGSEVILFSTHGVLPDPQSGIAEAGLVFTPPDAPSDDNDGLLSASEAAALDFTSDLLVLSACNTATEGSFEGADSLSGLARSFIFAGARSVYASHWRVNDNITKELMLAAIRIAIERPDVTRSEALRRAMQAIRTGQHADGTPVEGWTPDWSHPSAWAPFVSIVSG